MLVVALAVTLDSLFLTLLLAQLLFVAMFCLWAVRSSKTVSVCS